ncbi:MAG: hypothetical protein WA162_00355 [Thermodesulfobacteriota bacterium]
MQETVNLYDDQSYLFIRPVSENAAAAESFVEKLSLLPGFDKAGLKQNLIGKDLRVVRAHSDRNLLEDMAKEIEKAGVPAGVVSKKELLSLEKPNRAVSIEIEKNNIEFLSRDSLPVFTIRQGQKCLIVISTPAFKTIRDKDIGRKAINPDGDFSEATLDFILSNNPVAHVYSGDNGACLKIEGARFNYASLGEDNKQSAAQNLKFILKEIKRVAGTALLDTGFGGHSLPFVKTEDIASTEDFLREFTVYSGFVFLACKKGVFKKFAAEAEIPVLKELGGIFLTGPLLARKTEPGPNKPLPGIITLPPPPNPPRFTSRGFIGLRGASISRFITRYGRLVKFLGPPFIIHPLAAIIAASIIFEQVAESVNPLLAAAGAILFVHSLTLLRRKRIIENCPTSNIGTMPMGEVEIRGTARQKYFLKSPFSHIDCVRYSYAMYEIRKTSEGERDILKGLGDSGDVPFLIEDKTGRTLVNPSGAILTAGEKNSFSFRAEEFNMPYLGVLTAGNTKVIETIIPIGRPLYVMGFAKRVTLSADERKKSFLSRLMALKNDPSALKRYDADNDGKISAEEWDEARRSIEEEQTTEATEAAPKDDIEVGEHPSGGLFYISDSSEADMLASMSWRIPVFLTLGIALAAWGTVRMAEVVEKSRLLWYLINIINNLL